MEIVKSDNQFEDGLYLIEKDRILQSTTSDYRKFLKEAGYADLDSCSQLGIAKKVLIYNQDVRNILGRSNESDGNTVVNINHTDARNLIQRLGGKVLTTQLMYKLFIPYLEQLAEQGNQEAEATLDNMQFDTNGYVEWLEDFVIDKNKVRIGCKERTLTLPQQDGSFDRTDLNDLGYPKSVKDSGKHYYWYPRDNEAAVIRDGNSELDLNIDVGDTSIGGDRLGVRFTKFF